MISPLAKKEILRMQTQAKFPFLIKIVHEDLGTFRYVNSDDSVVYENETYEPAFFSIRRGARSEGTIQNAELTLSAIDQEWIVKIRTTQKRAKIYFVAAIIHGTPDVVEPIEIEEYTLQTASWNDLQITWEMIFDENMDVLIPSDIATSSKNPAVWS